MTNIESFAQMKVLLPVESEDDNKGSIVQHLDNSEYACIYDQATDSMEFLSMSSISAKKGNLCVELKRKGVEAMICSSIPSLALDLFSLMGIKIFQAQSATVEENITAFNNNALLPISGSSGLQMEGCASSSCASCSSAC